MSPRPTIDPGLAASVLSGAPARVARRLDDAPTAAEAWTWTVTDDGTWTIDAGGETVTLQPVDATITTADQLRCSCLLSPRCFHLLATVRRLEPGGGPAAERDAPDPAGPTTDPAPDGTGTVRSGAGSADEGGDGVDEPAPDHVVEVTPAQRAAAEQSWDAAAQVLAAGLRGVGALAQADLLRAAHACRRTGLPVLGAEITRLLGHVRALADDTPDFVLADASTALGELLARAHVLSGRGRAINADDIGTARRTYVAGGSSTLSGLGTEAVVTGSGYAGVVTWFVDEQGRTRSVSAVLPGEVDRVAAAYRSPVRLGTLSLDHRSAGRSHLHVQRMSVSADGRIGGGGGVQAAAAPRPAWDDDRWAATWHTPVAHQVGADDLVRFEGTILGRTDRSVLVGTADATVELVAPSDHAELAHRENLTHLGAAAGLSCRIVARPVIDRPRQLAAIAVHLPPGSSAALPASWASQVNLGLDRLDRSMLPSGPGTEGSDDPTGAGGGSGGPSIVVEASGDDHATRPLPGALVTRRLQRIALGGWVTLANAPPGGLDADLAQLRDGQVRTGAALLGRLRDEVSVQHRALTGEGRRPDRDAVARAWMAAERWADAADGSARRARWSQP